MKISLIVAISKNYIIGDKGFMPWNIPGELSRFRDLTTNNTIIMGRKTFESIGGTPLPNRRNIVISRTKDVTCDNCITVKSLQEALELCRDEEEVFIGGGGEIYRQCLPIAHRIYLTIIDKDFNGDVSFPKIDEDVFKKVYEERVEGEISYTYYTLDRIKE